VGAALLSVVLFPPWPCPSCTRPPGRMPTTRIRCRTWAQCAHRCEEPPGGGAGSGWRPIRRACAGAVSPGSRRATVPSPTIPGPVARGVVPMERPGSRSLCRDETTPLFWSGATIAGLYRAESADAGLYRAETAGADGPAVAGWILAADGQQRGGVGVDSGSTTKTPGVRVLTLAQPTFSVQAWPRLVSPSRDHSYSDP